MAVLGISSSAMKAIDFWSLVSSDPGLAPLEDVGLRRDPILMQDDDCVNRLSPLLMRNADRGYILDLGMSAKNLLHFGGIDVLPAADDHVALPIGKKK